MLYHSSPFCIIPGPISSLTRTPRGKTWPRFDPIRMSAAGVFFLIGSREVFPTSCLYMYLPALGFLVLLEAPLVLLFFLALCSMTSHLSLSLL